MRGVDGDSDSDRTEGSFCNGSESDEEGEGAEEPSAGIARSNESARGRGVSENVATPLPTTFARG